MKEFKLINEKAKERWPHLSGKTWVLEARTDFYDVLL